MLPAPTDVSDLVTFIAESCPAPLVDTPDLRAALEQGRHTRRALAELDQKRLVLGLLGGTGVGKSTLLNAIAGSTISRAGDRRPTTDRVICYRHVDFAIPKFLRDDDLSTPPPAHSIESLRGVTLLDLPDIDSVQTAHRERVHRVLPHLDLLVIVTSIDKYGDRLLYEELEAIPQAVQNAVIVLNAVDRIPAEQREVVLEDFRQKLETHVGWTETMIFPTSAKLAGEDPTDPGRHGLAPLLELMEELGGDERRRAVLAANAESHLDRFRHQLDGSLPPVELQAWFDRITALDLAAPTPSASLLSGFREELEESLGPWITDRALRASSFPIGWMHFLFRRFWRRRRARARDPFSAGHDPGRPYAEELVERPLRIAALEAAELARQQKDRVRFEFPAIPEAQARPTGSTLEEWGERLRRTAPRLGWRLRHHLLPAFTLVVTIGWVVAPVMRWGEGWLGATWDRLWSAVERLSPLQWAIAGTALLVYYLLCYPYFLYRLERRIEDEAENGVKLYTDHFQKEVARRWGDPVRSRRDGLVAWWNEYLKKRRKIGEARH
ncbi:MAG: 50S ribosome-binding GTPase [Planctomycetes bacterium]|nr:50S ribosome-binding GTPase [Planctomycetota bacterium]